MNPKTAGRREVTAFHLSNMALAVWVVGLLMTGFLIMLQMETIAQLVILTLLAYSLFIPVEGLLCVLMVLAPNDSMLAISGFISLTSAVVVVCLFKAFLEKGYAKIDRLLIIGCALLIVASLIRYLATGEAFVSGSFKIVLSFLIVGIFVLRIKENANRNDVYGLMDAFFVGCLVLLVLAMVNHFFFDLSYDRLRPVGGDPNYMALYLAVGIGLLFLRAFSGLESTLSCFGLCAIACFFILGGLLSQSRGFVIAAAPFCLFALFQFFRNLEKRPFLVFGLLSLFLILVLLLGFQGENIFREIINRFTSEETSNGSGRVLIWGAYFDHWSSCIETLLLGVPQDALGLTNADQTIAVHNMYLEVFCQQGLLFAMGFALDLLRIAHYVPKPEGVSSYIPFVSLGLGYLFLSGALSVTLPFIFLAACLAPFYSTIRADMADREEI